MDLPRGTFRSIQKGVRLEDILNDIIRTKFSGICTFSSGGAINGTFVFKSGACVLAKVQNQYGGAAWDEAGALLDQVFDIALSDLDNAQMQLALEFNKKAYVLKGGSRQATAAQKADAAPPAPEPKKRGAHHPRPGDRDFIKTTHAAADLPVPETSAEPKTFAAPPAEKKERVLEEQAPPVSGIESSAEKDFDTVESMDLDDVTQKIRKDCKIILKHLQLDHLTEK